MELLCGCLGLRWQRLEAGKVKSIIVMTYLAHYIYCKLRLSWSYFGDGYFAHLISGPAHDTRMKPEINVSLGGLSHSFWAVFVETGESVSPSFKPQWTLEMTFSIRLWQKCLRGPGETEPFLPLAHPEVHRMEDIQPSLRMAAGCEEAPARHRQRLSSWEREMPSQPQALQPVHPRRLSRTPADQTGNPTDSQNWAFRLWAQSWS